MDSTAKRERPQAEQVSGVAAEKLRPKAGDFSRRVGRGPNVSHKTGPSVPGPSVGRVGREATSLESVLGVVDELVGRLAHCGSANLILLTEREAAAILRVAPKTLRAGRSNGSSFKLPFIRPPGSRLIRYRLLDIIECLERGLFHSTSEYGGQQVGHLTRALRNSVDSSSSVVGASIQPPDTS